jgi:hypothetical protein
MYVYNIRLELQMEAEQRYVVNYLQRNGMKLPAIVDEPTAVYHKDAFDENRVEYWLHEMKSYRSNLSDRPSSGRPPHEDIDARILQALEAAPWSSVRTIAKFLKSPAWMVHLHLTTSLNKKIRYFNWVLPFLDYDLRANRFEGARQLLDVPPAQERCHFRDLVTGDETWVYLDEKPGAIWLPAEAELPVRVERTVSSDKCMLIVFWGIHGNSHYYWLPKDSTLNSPFFREEVLSPLAQKMQPNAKTLANP